MTLHYSIKHLKLEGFKSIRSLDLELKPLNVLIGANGSGKSNFISFFEMLNYLVKKELQLFVGINAGANNLLYYGRKVTDKILSELTFTTKQPTCTNSYGFSLTPTIEDSFIFANEILSFHDKNNYPDPHVFPSLGSGHNETLLIKNAQNPDKKFVNYVLTAMRSWRVYHFHDTSESAKMKQSAGINDNRFFRPDASNLAPFLFYLREREPNYYKNIIGVIRQVAPFFDDFFLEPNKLNPDTISLEWREKNSTFEFKSHSLSDGTLRFICLATLLLQPNPPSTIILDEPELGLHPYAIALLAEMLYRASQRTQLIIATQSVTLINHFEPEDIIVLDRKEKQSAFTRLSKKDLANWLEDYTIGELWEKNIFGGRPHS